MGHDSAAMIHDLTAIVDDPAAMANYFIVQTRSGVAKPNDFVAMIRDLAAIDHNSSCNLHYFLLQLYYSICAA